MSAATSPISGNPNYWGPEGRSDDERPKLVRSFYSTWELLQKASDALFNPGKYTNDENRWLASQLQQRAANMLENGDPTHE